MNIQVEFSYVEGLRNKISSQEKLIEQLESQLFEQGKLKLTEKAAKMAYGMFEVYISAVFKSLGFNETRISFDMNEIERALGKKWYYEYKNIKVKFGAEVFENFRKAYMSIGVLLPEGQEEVSEFSLDKN